MDGFDYKEFRWYNKMVYFLIASGFYVWWAMGSIAISSGQISTIPDPELDLYRLFLGSVALVIGIIRLQWSDLKYPTIIK